MRAMLIGMLGLAAFACGSSGPQAFLDTDKTTIRASLDSFTVYVVQHRDSTAAAMYAENATFMPPNQGMVQGRAAILAWMKTVPPMSHFTASAIDINGRGDLAYVRGTYCVAPTRWSTSPARRITASFWKCGGVVKMGAGSSSPTSSTRTFPRRPQWPRRLGIEAARTGSKC